MPAANPACDPPPLNSVKSSTPSNIQCFQGFKRVLEERTSEKRSVSAVFHGNPQFTLSPIAYSLVAVDVPLVEHRISYSDTAFRQCQPALERDAFADGDRIEQLIKEQESSMRYHATALVTLLTLTSACGDDDSTDEMSTPPVDDGACPVVAEGNEAPQALTAADLSGDVTLTDSPDRQVDYRVEGVISVGGVLTVEPGVVIEFASDAGLRFHRRRESGEHPRRCVCVGDPARGDRRSRCLAGPADRQRRDPESRKHHRIRRDPPRRGRRIQLQWRLRGSHSLGRQPTDVDRFPDLRERRRGPQPELPRLGADLRAQPLRGERQSPGLWRSRVHGGDGQRDDLHEQHGGRPCGLL